MLANRVFYTVKPFLPRSLQIFLRRRLFNYRLRVNQSVWPIDESAATPPEGWKGWPDGKKFALVLSHDVDTQRGHDNVMRLAELEMSLGFRSSFNFVPERYNLSRRLIDEVKAMGFEVCVHGLKHDGKLFWNKKIFSERAVKINEYMKDWGATGFTSPSMHHKLEWMNILNIEHATSTFDTDPFEPEPDGCGTIFPYWVSCGMGCRGYVELPYTLPQDFTLFVLKKEKDNLIWKNKLDWIVEKEGMALFNSHTDYMAFNSEENGSELYSVSLYSDFLEYINRTYPDIVWKALPKEVNAHYRKSVL